MMSRFFLMAGLGLCVVASSGSGGSSCAGQEDSDSGTCVNEVLDSTEEHTMKSSLLQVQVKAQQSSRLSAAEHLKVVEDRRQDLLDELQVVEDAINVESQPDEEEGEARATLEAHDGEEKGNAVDDDNVNVFGTEGYWRQKEGEPFRCKSSTNFGDVVQSERKGLALDDTSFEHCADQTPTHWPNTDQKIGSMRLFKPWGMTAPKWFHGDMDKAWKGLKTFAQNSGAKFLIGVSVTCQSWNDEKEWAAGRKFIEYVGSEHIMGIAVGNEIDLQVGAANGGCINNLWYRGGYKKILMQRVKEFDAIPGMKGLPVTAVMAMQSMSQYPFKWKVQKFLREVWEELGDRFTLSVNVYPQFDGGLRSHGCNGAAQRGPDFSVKDKYMGFMPGLVKDIRNRMAKVGGAGKKLWVGETGWATHAYCVLGCYQACNSKHTQERFYKGFLKWDLTDGFKAKPCGPAEGQCLKAIQWATTTGIYKHPDWYVTSNLTNESALADFQNDLAMKKRDNCPHTCDYEEEHGKPATEYGADHVFYFTLRDSYVFGKKEEFGIVNRCGDARCKFR